MDGSERIGTECDIRGFVTGRGGAGRSWSAKPGIAAAQTVEGVILDDTRRKPDLWLLALGESRLNFELVIWVTQPLVAAPGRTNASILWAIEDELRSRGIEIPFPQRDLHVRSGELRVRLADDRESLDERNRRNA
jgi:small-conductance mechanosensitive channel